MTEQKINLEYMKELARRQGEELIGQAKTIKKQNDEIVRLRGKLNTAESTLRYLGSEPREL